MKKSLILIIVFITVISCKKEINSCECNLTYSKNISGYQNEFEDTEILKIRYLSDTVEVSGFIVKPTSIRSDEKLPLIIYNRGGNRDFGAITKPNYKYLEYLSSLGYVVMASQYRGNSFSEGVDEFGGDDLNDVKCLIEIAKNINYIDTDNIGVIGYSRGGLMTYLLSKESDDIKTLITIGAPTDLFLMIKDRPEFYDKVFYELIGDSINHKQKYLDRSPINWSKKINEPILVMHGTADGRISIEHSLRIKDSLKNFPNKINFYLLEGGNHSLSNYRKLRNDTIASWFNYYLKDHQ